MAHDPAIAFETTLCLDPSLSLADLQAEIQRLVIRQQAIAGLLAGEVLVDVVEEMLFEDGIDPYQWAEVAEENLIYLLEI